MTELDMLKSLLEINDTEQDDMLNTYLTLAENKILHKMYPFGIPEDVSGIPSRYLSRKVEIAEYLYLKRGGEGELTHTENGITRQYARGDIPAELINDIPSFVKGLI